MAKVFGNQQIAMLEMQPKFGGGLFASDPNKNFWGRVWEVTSRLTWQLPQTISGFLGSHGTNMIGHVNKVDYAYGATVLQTNSYPSSFGAITIGSFIIGNREIEADANNRWFQHEYGHYLQSQKMGLGYLSRVGIPSLLSAKMDDGNHAYQPFEQDANRRAFMYFNKNVDGFYQTEAQYWANQWNGIAKGWNFSENPLDVNHEGIYSRQRYYDYYNPEHRALINSLSLHAKWYDYLDPFGLKVGTVNHLYYKKHRTR
ncbi:MAG: hypothetical protein PHS30_00930 [Bacteroidales bacterium]|nr:hypothetical protein [Bacteroidales bacterium]